MFSLKTTRKIVDKAFTLLELIVVIVILGILAVLATPSFDKIKDKSADSTAINNAKALIRLYNAQAQLDPTFSPSVAGAWKINGSVYSFQAGTDLQPVLNQTLLKEDDFKVGGIGPGGGHVFYYSSTPFTAEFSTCGTDCHFLEFAPKKWYGTDTDPARTFSLNTTASVGNTVLGYGAGSSNTQKINNQVDAGNSSSNIAKLALEYEGSDGSKGQWYIPSHTELKKMFDYNSSNSNPGEFIYDVWYSSSTENNVAKDTQSVGSAYEHYTDVAIVKTWQASVRPIRAF